MSYLYAYDLLSMKLLINYETGTFQYTAHMVNTEFHKCVHTLMYTIIGHLITQGMFKVSGEG